MMMKLRHLFLFVAMTAPAVADVTLYQSVKSPQGENQIVVFIKNQKIRTDVGQKSSTIVNTESGDSVTMIHDSKQMMRIDGAKVKAMQEAMAQNQDKAPKPVNTGKTETLNGRECQIWSIEMQGVKSTFWIDKAYPDYAQFKKDFEVMSKGMSKGMETTDFDGMVVKVVAEMQGQKTEVVLTSADTKPIDEKTFEIPSGYKDLVMPGAR